METLINSLIMGGIVVFIAAIVIFIIGYVKAPPDKAYIISGLRRKPRILIGRSGFMVPFLQRKDELYLKQVTIDVTTGSRVPTVDFINVMVNSVAKVRICPEPDTMALAMNNFLNKTPEEIIGDLQDSLQGNLREIIGTMSLQEISTDKEAFADEMKKKAAGDMRALGIDIVTFNVQHLEDEHGLIQDLGIDNKEKIKKHASIAKAEAHRDVAVAQAEADKAANDARVKAQLEIEQKNTDLAIREAELKKQADTKKADAEAAFEIQMQLQQKTINENTVNARIAEREREIELKEREVEVQRKLLNANVRETAEAERFEKEQQAEAERFERERKADAELFEEQKAAEAIRAKAAAEAEAIRVTEEAKAKAIQITGEAEAKAIQAKGLAEAEAIEKKAEAMKLFEEAAMAEMMINILPSVAAEVAKPLGAIDEVKIFGTDAHGVAGMSANVPTVMAQTFETIKSATGVDLTNIMHANSLDAKITRNLNMTGAVPVDTTAEQGASPIPEGVTVTTETVEAETISEEILGNS